MVDNKGHHVDPILLSWNIKIMKTPQLVALASATLLISGCISHKPETWTNRGPVTIDASKTGLIYCYEDANFINGERIVGTLCGEPTSGFWMQGEPVISFGPWNRKFMKVLVSKTTQGVEQSYEGKPVLLKCSPILNESNTETGRDCTVTISGQHLVSAKFIFQKASEAN